MNAGDQISIGRNLHPLLTTPNPIEGSAMHQHGKVVYSAETPLDGSNKRSLPSSIAFQPVTLKKAKTSGTNGKVCTKGSPPKIAPLGAKFVPLSQISGGWVCVSAGNSKPTDTKPSDPKLAEKDKDIPVPNDVVKEEKLPALDPRKSGDYASMIKQASKPCRTRLRTFPSFHYNIQQQQDKHTPSNGGILITGLHKTTTLNELMRFFKKFGVISTTRSRLEVSKISGGSLCVAYIAFDAGKDQDGHKCALEAARVGNGHSMGDYLNTCILKVVLDHDESLRKKILQDLERNQQQKRIEKIPTISSAAPNLSTIPNKLNTAQTRIINGNLNNSETSISRARDDGKPPSERDRYGGDYDKRSRLNRDREPARREYDRDSRVPFNNSPPTDSKPNGYSPRDDFRRPYDRHELRFANHNTRDPRLQSSDRIDPRLAYDRDLRLVPHGRTDSRFPVHDRDHRLDIPPRKRQRSNSPETKPARVSRFDDKFNFNSIESLGRNSTIPHNNLSYLRIKKSDYFSQSVSRSPLDVQDIKTFFKGYAVEKAFTDAQAWYITFKSTDEAAIAFNNLNNRKLHGHLVKLDVITVEPPTPEKPIENKNDLPKYQGSPPREKFNNHSMTDLKPTLTPNTPLSTKTQASDPPKTTSPTSLLDEILFTSKSSSVKLTPKKNKVTLDYTDSESEEDEPLLAAVDKTANHIALNNVAIDEMKAAIEPVAMDVSTGEVDELSIEEETIVVDPPFDPILDKRESTGEDEDLFETDMALLMDDDESDFEMDTPKPKKAKVKPPPKKKPQPKSKPKPKPRREITPELMAAKEDFVPEPVHIVPEEEQTIVASVPLKPMLFPEDGDLSNDPYNRGLAADQEDLFFLKMAILQARNQVPEPVYDPVLYPQDDLGTWFPHPNTGCARLEGYYKMSVQDRMANRPKNTIEVVQSHSSMAVSREARANTRVMVKGMKFQNKTAATDGDVLKFNQLKSRKKQLAFARSGIEGYGLFAKEYIPIGDMVIEYVGELIRTQVADRREIVYERQGIGSSYLFRIDDDIVIDATKKGNLGRLINHCCVPNCTARIITINGEKKIVIYAKANIEPGDEITYDYHFSYEDNKLPCYCGHPMCRKFLN